MAKRLRNKPFEPPTVTTRPTATLFAIACLALAGCGDSSPCADACALRDVASTDGPRDGALPDAVAHDGPRADAPTSDGAGDAAATADGPAGDSSQRDGAAADVTAADANANGSVRVATFNVQDVGYSASAEFAALAAILRRVDADVVCMQEVRDWESARLSQLAATAGYPHVFQGKVSSWMAGGLTNACLSRLTITASASLASSDISSDSSASEIARDMVYLRVVAPGGARHLALFNMHFKSGFTDADRLRRQVETLRLRQRLLQHLAQHSGDAVVALGDFNEEVNGAQLGQTFSAAPSGLPASFKLGNDLSFPIRYEPFATLTKGGPLLLLSDPTHEDSTTEYGTRIPSGKRIDFVLYRGATLRGDEVYEACADNGVDDAPPGQWLGKAGAALTCGTSLDASDHRPVVVDLAL